MQAALDAMGAEWPGSKNWPIATGGFSGGAKYSGYLGGVFVKDGRKLLGIFQGGCDQDAATIGVDYYKPRRKELVKAKGLLSGGKDDKVATVTHVNDVPKSLKRTGLDQVEVEFFEGGHELCKDNLAPALKWFAEPLPGQ